MPEQFTQAEFVTSLREKYPVYNDIDDSTLVANVVEKYPVYKNQISDFGAPIEKEIPEEKSFAQKALGFIKEKFTFSPEQEAKFGELVEGFRLPKKVRDITEKAGREGFLDIYTDELRKELADKPVAGAFIRGLFGERADIGQEVPEAKTIPEKVVRGAAGLAGTVISFAPVAKATKAIGIGARIARKSGIAGRLIGSAETFVAHGQLLSKSKDYEERLDIAGEDLTTGLAFGLVGGLGKDYLKGLPGKFASYPSMFGLGFGMSKMGESSNEDAIINGALLVALHGIHDIGGKKADTRASKEFLTKKLESEGIKKPEGIIKKAFERAEEFKKNNPEAYEALTAEPGFKIDKSVVFEEKPSIEPKIAKKPIEAVVTPKEAVTSAEARLAQEKKDLEPAPEVVTRKATYIVQEDGKIIKTAKGVETEVTKKELDEVIAQKKVAKEEVVVKAKPKEKPVIKKEVSKEETKLEDKKFFRDIVNDVEKQFKETGKVESSENFKVVDDKIKIKTETGEFEFDVPKDKEGLRGLKSTLTEAFRTPTGFEGLRGIGQRGSVKKALNTLKDPNSTTEQTESAKTLLEESGIGYRSNAENIYKQSIKTNQVKFDNLEKELQSEGEKVQVNSENFAEKFKQFVENPQKLGVAVREFFEKVVVSVKKFLGDEGGFIQFKTKEGKPEPIKLDSRKKALAFAHILEKEMEISTEKGKEIKKEMFGTETMAEMSTNEISQYSEFIRAGKTIKDVPVAPKEVTTKKRQELIESVQKKHGQTELRIAELKKKGLTDKDIDAIVLEDGTKFSETVKVKREKTGVLSAVITKDDIKNVKDSYTKEKPVDKWRTRKPFVDKLTVGKEEAKRLYELPQVIFQTSGLKKILYDPVIKAERSARDLKTDIYARFQKANLLKPGNAVLPDRFLLSKKERRNISLYYLDRQGKKTGVTFDKLSARSKKFVGLFDKIIKENEKKFFEVAKKNGLEPEKVENYAPLLTKSDIELAEDVGLMDFITRKHPAFFSTKERAEKVPIEVYEKDYAKVATTWIDKMADFIYIGEVLPEIKYLTDSKEFSDIVTAWDKKYIDTWVHDIATPRVEKPLLKEYAKPLRKAASIAALGANIIPVVKQSLTQIPLTFVERAPPRLRSRFAKDFGVTVKDLPAIRQRKGNVAIQDMQEGYARVVVGSLTEFDKYNARLSLNALLDKSYKKYKKEGLPIDEKVQELIIKEAQDKLDLWYGGMTKAQMPEAFRSEAGKLLNMFIYPLTSQLNGFYLQVAKARGFGKKSKAIAEVLSAATAIAYAEQALTKMTFKWSNVEEMSKDIVESLAGNIPVLGSIVFALANEQPYSPSPIINSVTNLFKKLNKVVDEPQAVDELFFAIAEMFGLPKQARRTYEGIQFAKEGGFRDKRGKLLAPALKGDRLRAVIRGKYGTLAVQEYLNNIGKKVENRKWTHPEVEFLQNGDYKRKAQIYRKLDRKTKIFLFNELSKAQKKKLRDNL